MSRLLVSFVIVAAIVGSAEATDAGAASAIAYTVLDETSSQLREDFNRAKGSVRLLFVVDPVCPGCLRGLDDLNKALLATTQAPRLQTFVVHLPVLKPAATGEDVPPAAALLQNPNVRHYWNPSGAFGRQLAKGVGLEHEGDLVYAWDVWLIYGPQATWSGDTPPKPRRLMHQLRALRGSKDFLPLDGQAFAREVQRLLAQHPPQTAAR